MSLESKAIAEEIVTLEKMIHDGEIEYSTVVTEELWRPIAPRLRYLHAKLAETGKGPLT